jgi:hypothetical protein
MFFSIKIISNLLYNMDNYISPITDNLIDLLTKEISKVKNRKKIMKNIIQPILEDINKKYYPHFMALISLLVIMTIMMIGLTIIIYNGSK